MQPQLVIVAGGDAPKFREIERWVIGRQQRLLNQPFEARYFAKITKFIVTVEFRQILREARARGLQIARAGRMARVEAARTLAKIILADQAPNRRVTRPQA